MSDLHLNSSEPRDENHSLGEQSSESQSGREMFSEKMQSFYIILRDTTLAASSPTASSGTTPMGIGPMEPLIDSILDLEDSFAFCHETDAVYIEILLDCQRKTAQVLRPLLAEKVRSLIGSGRKRLDAKIAVDSSDSNRGQRHINVLMETLGQWSDLLTEFFRMVPSCTVFAMTTFPLHQRVIELAFECFEKFKISKNINTLQNQINELHRNNAAESVNISLLDTLLCQLLSFREIMNRYYCYYCQFLQDLPNDNNASNYKSVGHNEFAKVVQSLNDDMLKWREIDFIYISLENGYFTQSLNVALIDEIGIVEIEPQAYSLQSIEDTSFILNKINSRSISFYSQISMVNISKLLIDFFDPIFAIHEIIEHPNLLKEWNSQHHRMNLFYFVTNKRMYRQCSSRLKLSSNSEKVISIDTSLRSQDVDNGSHDHTSGGGNSSGSSLVNNLVSSFFASPRFDDNNNGFQSNQNNNNSNGNQSGNSPLAANSSTEDLLSTALNLTNSLKIDMLRSNPLLTGVNQWISHVIPSTNDNEKDVQNGSVGDERSNLHSTNTSEMTSNISNHSNDPFSLSMNDLLMQALEIDESTEVNALMNRELPLSVYNIRNHDLDSYLELREDSLRNDHIKLSREDLGVYFNALAACVSFLRGFVDSYRSETETALEVMSTFYWTTFHGNHHLGAASPQPSSSPSSLSETVNRHAVDANIEELVRIQHMFEELFQAEIENVVVRPILAPCSRELRRLLYFSYNISAETMDSRSSGPSLLLTALQPCLESLAVWTSGASAAAKEAMYLETATYLSNYLTWVICTRNDMVTMLVDGSDVGSGGSSLNDPDGKQGLLKMMEDGSGTYESGEGLGGVGRGTSPPFSEWGAMLIFQEVTSLIRMLEERCDSDHVNMREAFSRLLVVLKVLTLDAVSEVPRYKLPSSEVSEDMVRKALVARVDFNQDAAQRVKINLV